MTKSANGAPQLPSTLRVDLAKVDWDASNSPRAPAFDDVYFSASGAEFETEHVFLKANDLSKRWASLKDSDSTFLIGEIGFGTGLNFIKTLQLWDQTHDKPSKLHYVAFEKHPLALEDMRRAHSNWPHLQPYFEQLLSNYFPFSQVCYRLGLSPNVTLDLHFGDALSRLKTLVLPEKSGIHCWFLDGFSPRLNADLWSAELCQELARLCAHNATLSTYSAAGWVRNNLTSSGFDVSKAAGFAGKRHMLSATIHKPKLGPSPPASMAAWAISPSPQHKATNALVIGAGLAGSSAAYALAQKGLQVTVVDSSPEAASGASGLKQLALRPRLFRECSATAELYLQAYLWAQQHYEHLQGNNYKFWQQCGVLQSVKAQNKKNPISPQQLVSNYGDPIVSALTSEQASELAGLSLIDQYIYFQTGGWLDPEALCSVYLSHPNIACEFSTRIESIENTDGTWLSKQHSTDREFKSDIVVLANGLHAGRFTQTHGLPLEAVRGQATYIEVSSKSSPLAKVVMGQRSVFPSFNGLHTVAASYRREESLQHSQQDDLENLAGMKSLFGEGADHSPLTCGSKVALRCNSIDFLPVVGMVASAEKTRRVFAPLRRNAHAAVSGHDHFHHGLYISAGHGSNGATTCPLSAQYIADLACNDPGTLSEEMISLLSPARFLIRELKQQV